MSNFKTKDTKNKYKEEITSLDYSHTNFINNMTKKETQMKKN